MANGPFFPGPLVPIFGPCTCVCVVRGFAQFSMACVRFRTSTGHFFPVSSYRPLLVRVRVRGSYVVFAWRASGSVHDGWRALFSRVPVQAVHGSVYVCVPRTRFCPVLRGARPVPCTTGVGHFFSCVPVQAVHGAVYESVYVCLPHTWLCPILHGARLVPSTPVSCPFLPGRMLLRFLPVSPFT